MCSQETACTASSCSQFPASRRPHVNDADAASQQYLCSKKSLGWCSSALLHYTCMDAVHATLSKGGHLRSCSCLVQQHPGEATILPYHQHTHHHFGFQVCDLRSSCLVQQCPPGTTTLPPPVSTTAPITTPPVTVSASTTAQPSTTAAPATTKACKHALRRAQ